MYFTQTDIVNMKLTANRTLSPGEIIKNLINDSEIKDARAEMTRGVDYFSVKNPKIAGRKKEYYVDGYKKIDVTAANNRLKHGFHRNLLLQKINYALKNPINFSIDSENDALVNAMTDVLNAHGIFSDAFKNKIIDLCIGAGNKGVEWLHPYISENELNVVVMDSRNILPIYDTHYQDKLTSLIRYYDIKTVDSYGKEKTKKKAEWWDSEKVTYYIEGEDGVFLLDPSESENPRYHFKIRNTAIENSLQGRGWDRVPFIKMKNTSDEVSDFRLIETLVDAYDLSRSELANTLEDVMDALIAISGATGEKASEMRENLKTYKLMLLAEDQKAEALTVPIPKEARELHEKTLREDIYQLGMGLDVSSDKFGNSPSGVALRFLFAPLDLKADAMLSQLRQALSEYLTYVFDFERIVSNKKYDPSLVKIGFTKDMIINEAEKIQSARNSLGVVSNRTILENHPWVKDVDAELELLQKDEQARVKLFESNNDELQ